MDREWSEMSTQERDGICGTLLDFVTSQHQTGVSFLVFRFAIVRPYEFDLGAICYQSSAACPFSIVEARMAGERAIW